MDKILITIFVPSIEDSFDIRIPINSDMKEAMELIQQAINELSNDTYMINSRANLYDKATGKVINLSNIVKFSGLKNGSTVILH